MNWVFFLLPSLLTCRSFSFESSPKICTELDINTKNVDHSRIVINSCFYGVPCCIAAVDLPKMNTRIHEYIVAESSLFFSNGLVAAHEEDDGIHRYGRQDISGYQQRVLLACSKEFIVSSVDVYAIEMKAIPHIYFPMGSLLASTGNKFLVMVVFSLQVAILNLGIWVL